MDLYAVLGVEPDADDADIRAAYKRKAVMYHPDKNIGEREDAEIRFKLVNEAYETLSDPSRRSKYDASRRRRRTQPNMCSTSYDVEIDEFGMLIHDMRIHALASIDDAFDTHDLADIILPSAAETA